jgi:hypothetical protein
MKQVFVCYSLLFAMHILNSHAVFARFWLQVKASSGSWDNFRLPSARAAELMAHGS